MGGEFTWRAQCSQQKNCASRSTPWPMMEQPQCAQHSIRDLEDVSGLIALPEYGPTGLKPFDWLPMK